MQAAINARKPRNQAISGHFRAGRTYRGRIKDDHKIDCAVDGGGFLMPTVELLGSRQWKSPCTRHLGRVEATAPPPTGYYKEEGQRLICSRIRTGPEATAKSGGFVLTELCGFIPVNKRSR